MTDQQPNVTLFYEWDYDKDRVITWERAGECNHCGQCCKDAHLINYGFLNDEESNHFYEEKGIKPKDGSLWPAEEGIWTEQAVENDDDRRFFGNVRVIPQDEPWKPCPSWTGTGCALHGLDKPGLCKTWPHTPTQIEGFTECSYTFTKINEEVISEKKESEE